MTCGQSQRPHSTDLKFFSGRAERVESVPLNGLSRSRESLFKDTIEHDRTSDGPRSRDLGLSPRRRFEAL